MDSTKEINNNTKEFDDCLISTQDDCIIIPNQEEDVPVTKEEEQAFNEILEDGTLEEKKILREEYEECKKFYTKLKGYNRYDLTESNFKYWKGKPYVGTGYREFIQKSSKIMVCTALINERVQINIFDKLIKNLKNGDIPIDKGILKFVKTTSKDVLIKTDLDYVRKGEQFLQWRFKSHLYRFGFIKKYLQDEYQLDYNDFRCYNNVESYFNLL